MSDVAANFLKPMLTLYGDINTDDADLFFGVYTRQLAGFSDAVLKAGFEIIAGDFFPSKKSPWPAPALCKKACEKAMKTVQPATVAQWRGDTYPEWSDKRRRLADTLIQCDLGRQAAAEGWIGALWDFCRQEGRRPHFGEIHKLKHIALDFDKAFCECSEGDFHIAAALRNLGKNMLARRAALARIANGEVL